MYNLTSRKLRTSKPPRMFQWDAVDTSPDLGGHSVVEPFEMAVRHNRRTTRTEIEFSLAGFIFTYVQDILWLSYRGASPPLPPYGSATAC